ncbi:hypothetical protein [Streptomyces griseorubiginosus]|uniref:hypothetical protein n=1 Tax=Streptomyces griseorubiginosus TaxID=67304 RepID=UPI001AD69BDA|nr:hypothetical protein [Streptomyces griseorubiginosus]MBO4258394.1 hypothetical protein [Streptomyces griseorubiginosus]
MERADILKNLAGSGTGTAPQRLTELAAELDIPAADLLVVAGHPVPAALLPPERDAKVVRQFAYRVSHCDHVQLALLEGFVRSLPRVAAPTAFVQPASPHHRPAETGFAAVLNGLIRNRGFGVRELPFVGLSLSTARPLARAPGALAGRPGAPICPGWHLAEVVRRQVVAARKWSKDARGLAAFPTTQQPHAAAGPLAPPATRGRTGGGEVTDDAVHGEDGQSRGPRGRHR